MANRKKILEDNMFKRTMILVVLALFFWLLLFLRLVQVQIINRSIYLKQANNQYIYEAELKSQRGIIYDRKLEPLAVSRKTNSIGVDISQIANHDSVARIFSELFKNDKDYYLKKLSGSSPFFWIQRRVEDNLKSLLDTLSVPGVRVIKETKRFYPRGSLASHVVGFANIDQKGLSGIELANECDLKGNNGLALYNRDAYGQKIVDIKLPVKKPQKGKNVVLTIDNTIQWISEEELKYAVNKYDAEAGIVIIANPNTGEILSLAVSPDFDLNQAGNYVPESRRNRAITDVYEPGSTFKSIIMAAVLEEGAKKPTDIVFCENGKYNVYDRVVTDVTPYTWLSLQKVIKKSSNVGMAKIAQELDQRLIFKYIRDFGFGLETGIGLPGEASGELKHYVDWSKYTPIAMSIGYEISVTPIQMVMAYSAIANGGLLLKPKICLGVANKVSKKPIAAKPEIIRRVISDSTAKTLTDMLEEVVFDGTGKRAFINGLRIAGKTGTAIKYDPELKKYRDDKFVSSFIGFFPVESPQMLIFVMIDNPKKDHLGGMVAAPTFKRVLQRVIRYVDVNPNINSPSSSSNESTNEMLIPDLVNKRLDTAFGIANYSGFELIVRNQGDLVASQKMVIGKWKSRPKLVVTLKDFNESNELQTQVPSVIGKNIRDAVSSLAQRNLKVYVSGSGIVVSQNPAPGEKVQAGARCVINCKLPIDLVKL